MIRRYGDLHGLWNAVAVGAVVGLLLAPLAPAAWHGFWKLYDRHLPVVSMHGELLARPPGEAVLALSGHKHRDCRYMGLQAYTLEADGELHDVYRARVDVSEHRRTKPIGRFDFGNWRIWPVPDNARAVVVFVQHECSGRLVTTKVADVPVAAP